jgi:hypothetical protein
LGKKYFGVAKCRYNEMTSKPSKQKPTKQNVSTILNNCFMQTTSVMNHEHDEHNNNNQRTKKNRPWKKLVLKP